MTSANVSSLIDATAGLLKILLLIFITLFVAWHVWHHWSFFASFTRFKFGGFEFNRSEEVRTEIETLIANTFKSYTESPDVILYRANTTFPALVGGKILWADQNQENNLVERRILE